jgi:hypothetical protein
MILSMASWYGVCCATRRGRKGVLSDNINLTFWRRVYRNDAKWRLRGVANLVNPPFATGTYPAWYTAALRPSAPFPGDGSPEDETPESDITHDTFRIHMDTGARAVRHRPALSNVQGGSRDRVRDKTSGPSH